MDWEVNQSVAFYLSLSLKGHGKETLQSFSKCNFLRLPVEFCIFFTLPQILLIITNCKRQNENFPCYTDSYALEQYGESPNSEKHRHGENVSSK